MSMFPKLSYDKKAEENKNIYLLYQYASTDFENNTH